MGAGAPSLLHEREDAGGGGAQVFLPVLSILGSRQGVAWRDPDPRTPPRKPFRVTATVRICPTLHRLQPPIQMSSSESSLHLRSSSIAMATRTATQTSTGSRILYFPAAWELSNPSRLHCPAHWRQHHFVRVATGSPSANNNFRK